MHCSYCRVTHAVAKVLLIRANAAGEAGPPICADREACMQRRYLTLALAPDRRGGFVLGLPHTDGSGLVSAPLTLMFSGSMS